METIIETISTLITIIEILPSRVKLIFNETNEFLQVVQGNEKRSSNSLKYETHDGGKLSEEL